MTRADVEQEIQRITDKIVKEFEPEQIILFGSWAWSTPRLDSDVDLLVVKKSQKKTLDLMREVDRITFDRHVALDTLVYTPTQCRRRFRLGDPFIRKILTEGKVLYERPSSA